jgi:hypothetical protein
MPSLYVSEHVIYSTIMCEPHDSRESCSSKLDQSAQYCSMHAGLHASCAHRGKYAADSVLRCVFSVHMCRAAQHAVKVWLMLLQSKGVLPRRG